MAEAPLLTAVALALTGERPALGSGEAPRGPAGEQPQQLVEQLAALGWDASAVQQLREQVQADGRPWPFEVPRELLAEAGFARCLACLKEVRRLLGVDGLVGAVHRGPKVLGPAELRLLAEVPPHHGSVG